MLRAVVLAVPLLALVVIGGVALDGGSQAASEEPAPSPSSSSSPSEPSPSPSPAVDYELPLPSQTPGPTPAPHTGPLKAGDWVQVTGAETCLNVRTQPGVASPYPDADPSTAILNCLPDGFVGRISTEPWMKESMPVQADGHWWWSLVGQGWVAEDWLAFHHEGDAPYPQRPELAGLGLIAYIGTDSNVWVMRADGSGPRLLHSRSGEESFGQISWSPDGTRLLISVSRPAADPVAASLTRLIDALGVTQAEYPGLTSASST